VAQGGAATSFPHQAVNVDTGYHPTPNDPTRYDFHLIVTRLSSDGFYVTDLCDDVEQKAFSDAQDKLASPSDPSSWGHSWDALCAPVNGQRYQPRGYASVFAYNFSTPPLMRQCDRLRSFAGTASDFYGFTEIGFPTWELEPWDPQKRPCMIPPAHQLVACFKDCDKPSFEDANDIVRDGTTGLYSTPQKLTQQIAAVVRLVTDPDHKIEVHVSKHFGPNFPKAPAYAPEDDATNCDLNRDSKVDFTVGTAEATCAAACALDTECTEYSNFQQHSAFNLVVQNPDPSGVSQDIGTILADGSTAADFDPVALRGRTIHSFTGTLR
jgi:hypothetical protein